MNKLTNSTLFDSALLIFAPQWAGNFWLDKKADDRIQLLTALTAQKNIPTTTTDLEKDNVNEPRSSSSPMSINEELFSQQIRTIIQHELQQALAESYFTHRQENTLTTKDNTSITITEKHLQNNLNKLFQKHLT
ncbi:MAG: hypothetical protein ACJASB_003981 [Shewanella psychromarinicola]|jgi:hypothetical protein|uniref:hypothetical protein n=1 Tax=Shewanella psychromarinicola TaxID=2487742 RepID=UPI003AC97DF9